MAVGLSRRQWKWGAGRDVAKKLAILRMLHTAMGRRGSPVVGARMVRYVRDIHLGVFQTP